MLPKKGRKLPVWTGVLGGREIFARTIAELLRKEHGDSHRAIKQLMRQTSASERTAKHWLSAQHGPDTIYFLRLMVSSPVIRAFVLGLIEGPTSKASADPVDRFSRTAARRAYTIGEVAGELAAMDVQQDDPRSDTERDPINDPEPPEINERQRWFLVQIETRKRYGAREIMTAWQVSLKTARRDIGALQKALLLEYVGSPRKGRYRRLLGRALV